MSKKIQDLTMGEVFRMCLEKMSCEDCPFYKKGLIKNDDGFCMSFNDVFHLNMLNNEVADNE